MKRPLATVGFSYLLALVAAVTFGLNFSIIFAVFFAFLAFLAFKDDKVRKKLVFPIVFTTVAVAFTVFSIYTYFFVQPVSLLYGREAYVYGTVVQQPYFEYDKYYTVIDVESVDIENSVQNFKMRVSLDTIDDIEISDDLYLKVRFSQIPDRIVEYRRSKGVLIYGYQLQGTNLEIFKQSNPLIRGIYSFRNGLTESINEIFPTEIAQELTACLTGDTVNMDSELKNQFKRSGLSHLLAVSGLHLSIISFVVLYIFKCLRIRKRISYSVSTVIIVLFMIMTGFSPSVVRAGIMTIVIMVGKIINKEADSLNSLGFACLLMCLVKPYAAVDIGFMLSVAATFGLIVFMPILQAFFRRKLDKKIENDRAKSVLGYVADSFAMSFAALIPTMPIALIFFKEISLVSPISNLLVVQLFSYFMIFGGLTAMIAQVGFLVFLSKPFEIITLLLGKVINGIIGFMSDLSFATIKLPYTFVSLWICAVLLITAFALYLKKNTQLFKKVIIYSALFFAVGASSYLVFNSGVMSIQILDTSEGSSVIISKNGNNFIVGCGGDSYDMVDVNDILTDEEFGICKAVILPTLEKADTNNFISINRLFTPESVYCGSDGVFYDEIIRHVSSDDVYSIENAEFSPFKNATVKIVSDSEGNNWTIVDYKNLRLLFCPISGNADLLADDLKKSDIIFISSADIKHISAFKGSMYVVCANQLDATKIKLMLLSNDKDNIIMTGGDGSLKIQTRGGRNITVGRN